MPARGWALVSVRPGDSKLLCTSQGSSQTHGPAFLAKASSEKKRSAGACPGNVLSELGAGKEAEILPQDSLPPGAGEPDEGRAPPRTRHTLSLHAGAWGQLQQVNPQDFQPQPQLLCGGAEGICGPTHPLAMPILLPGLETGIQAQAALWARVLLDLPTSPSRTFSCCSQMVQPS